MSRLHPEQRRILQSMTPEMKLRVAVRLCQSARELELSSSEIDFAMLEEKVKEYGLQSQWELVKLG